jgi:hypothetical protein
MARMVFYSFHYKPDCWRASQVRNAGVIEGNRPATDNDWETITRGGDDAIKRWIASQMDGKSCAVVLVGENTANRKWINYEIKKAWEEGKGLVGVHIHGLQNQDGDQCVKGGNPFDYITFTDGKKLSTVVKVYNPPFQTSKYVYDHIKENLSDWVEDGVNP